jgi:plastocyanin
MKMKSARILAASVSALFLLQSAQAGDITGKVTVKGNVPANKTFAMDPMCGKLHKVNKHEMPFYVVGKEGGLGDTLVQLKLTGKSQGAAAEAAMIDQVNCFYTPYVAAVQTGQTLKVRNSDPLMHNVHPTPRVAGNKEQNIAQPFKGMVNDFKFDKPEMFLRFKCDVHPWMFAYVSVLDHPYFAVTDKDGNFTIKNVPDGEYTIEAVHRKVHPKLEGATQKVKVSGGAAVNFELEVK